MSDQPADNPAALDPRLGMGGNAPPAEEQLRDELEAGSGDLQRRVEELEAAAARVPAEIVNDDQAQRLTDMIGQVNAAIKHAEAKRAEAKAPYMRLANLAYNFFSVKIDRLDAVKKTTLAPRLKAWQDKKRLHEERKRQEELERRRQAEEQARKEREARERAEEEARQQRIRAEAAERKAREDAQRAEAERRRLEAEAERLKQEAEAQRRKAAEAEAKRKSDAKAAKKREAAAAKKARLDAEAKEAEAERLKQEAEARQAEAQQAERQAEAAVQQQSEADAEIEESAMEARQARRLEVHARSDTMHAEKQLGTAHKVATVRGDFGAVASLRRHLDFKVTNPDAIPRRFLMLDETALRRHINQTDGADPVPGIETFEVNETQVRA